MNMMAWSRRVDFLQLGRGRHSGWEAGGPPPKWRFCTSWAAASMLRSNVNCRVTLVRPRTLVDVIESSPGTVENCRSRTVATEAAMVSGLAPGRFAWTCMVG